MECVTYFELGKNTQSYYKMMLTTSISGEDNTLPKHVEALSLELSLPCSSFRKLLCDHCHSLGAFI